MFLLKNIASTYSITCSWVRTVVGKLSLYSTCFTIFSWVKTVANKKSFFYLANLYSLSKTLLISVNKHGLIHDLVISGESTIVLWLICLSSILQEVKYA